MSKDYNPEAQVEQTTSQATENENMVTISAKELNELRERNASLIAERVALMVKVKQVKEKLENVSDLQESNAKLREKVSTLEKNLTETQESHGRVMRYWREAEDKLKTVCAALEVVNPTEYMTGLDFIKKIANI